MPLKTISTSYRSRIYLRRKNLSNLNISKWIFYFVRWEYGFHIFCFYSSKSSFCNLTTRKFYFASSSLPWKQRNNYQETKKRFYKIMEPIPKSPPTGLELRSSPEDHPGVLTIKGVKDEVNHPGEKGFDILSHQLGKWKLSRFSHRFLLAPMW